MTIISLNPRPVMTMIRRKIALLGALSIQPKTGRFPQPHFSVVPSISNLKRICIIAWAFMTIGLTTLSQPVQGASSPPRGSDLIPQRHLELRGGRQNCLKPITLPHEEFLGNRPEEVGRNRQPLWLIPFDRLPHLLLSQPPCQFIRPPLQLECFPLTLVIIP